MIDKKEVLMRLACAALQGGMPLEEIVDGLTNTGQSDYIIWDIAHIIYPNTFGEEEEDKSIIDTKNKY